MNDPSPTPRILWRIVDGKPGHENQSLGLCQALERLRPVQRIDIMASPRLQGLGNWLLGRFPSAANLPPPDLIIGAGHRTHIDLLAARRAFGGRSIVLMKPSLPCSLFDLCLIPLHDQPKPDEHILATEGALNPIYSDEEGNREQTLLLIGGPSRHYDWSDSSLLAQIGEIVGGSSGKIVLTTSRRTPATFLEQLRQSPYADQFSIVPVAETGPGWVKTELLRSHSAWVTEDSVSMVYEALTAGCALGLLTVPQKQANRISRGVQDLWQKGWVSRFDDWRKQGGLRPPPPAFNEAQRCARWIAEHWWSAN